MIIVSGKVKTQPGAVDKLRDAAAEVVNATRAEEGCIDYSFGVDALEPDVIIVLEYWESWDALQNHFTAPHMAKWMKTIGEAGVVSTNLRFIEAGEERNPMG